MRSTRAVKSRPLSPGPAFTFSSRTESFRLTARWSLVREVDLLAETRFEVDVVEELRRARLDDRVAARPRQQLAARLDAIVVVAELKKRVQLRVHAGAQSEELLKQIAVVIRLPIDR